MLFSLFFIILEDSALFLLSSSIGTGNLSIIVTVVLEKTLQSTPNYLIVNLAVADLMVACLVMPLAAIYERGEALNSLILPGSGKPEERREWDSNPLKTPLQHNPA